MSYRGATAKGGPYGYDTAGHSSGMQSGVRESLREVAELPPCPCRMGTAPTRLVAQRPRVNMDYLTPDCNRFSFPLHFPTIVTGRILNSPNPLNCCSILFFGPTSTTESFSGAK